MGRRRSQGLRRHRPGDPQQHLNDNNAGYGGGYSLNAVDDAVLEGNALTRNTTTYYGGGAEFYDTTATLTGEWITGNSAEWGGGGLYCSYSDLDFDDAVIEDNGSQNAYCYECGAACESID